MRLALLLAVLGSTDARAGGYYYSDSGIVALGRGGAWVAGANTQFAQYYNPAGLLKVPAPTVNVGYSGVQQHVRFERQDADGTTYPAAENQAKPYSVPEFGFASPVGDRFAVAFGFTSPFAPSALYDPDGAQRYTVIDTTIYQFQVGPSVAWRPVPWLGVGASLQWQYLGVFESLKLTTSLVETGDSPESDVNVAIGAQDLFTPSYNLGVLIEPTPVVSIGVSVQPPIGFDGRGDAEIDFTGNGLTVLLDESVYQDDDIGLALQIPLVLKAGVAVRPVPRVEVEAAWVYQDWSTFDDLVISDVDITLASSLALPAVPDAFVLPSNLDDTMSWRLGGEWRAHQALAVRAGGFWEDGALNDTYNSVALYDASKWQLGGGATGFLLAGRLRLDGSAAYLRYASTTAQSSGVTQVNALGGPAAVVGNGRYTSDGWIAGAAASWSFGKEIAW